MLINIQTTRQAIGILSSISTVNSCKIISLLEKEPDLELPEISKKIGLDEKLTHYSIEKMRKSGVILSRRIERKHYVFCINPHIHEQLMKLLGNFCRLEIMQ